jgi:acylphosphatase
VGTITKLLKIRGRVQGVGFRYSLYDAAKNLGVTGWVRNCRDGSVEVMVQGSETAVKSAIEWAKKGPDMAEIEHVDISEGSGEFKKFLIRETA